MSAAEFKRADRVGSAMQRELAVLIRDLKDLPGGLVTVQEVRVSRDLSHAKVYFTVIGADADDTLADLKHAAGYLRRELAATAIRTRRNAPSVRPFSHSITASCMRDAMLMRRLSSVPVNRSTVQTWEATGRSLNGP